MYLSELQKGLLGYSSQDDMGLWIISRRIYDSSSTDKSYYSVRIETIKVIRMMLQNGWLVVGKPIEINGGIIFQLYSLSVDEVIAFIENEWDKLDRLPDLGEICWFRATPAGKQLAIEQDLIE
jgi:hypothetical protein